MDVMTFWMYYFLCCFYLSDWQDEHSLVILCVCVCKNYKLKQFQEMLLDTLFGGYLWHEEKQEPPTGNLEKEMATHSSVLAWGILWTEEPGGLQSMGSQESDMTR